MVFATRHIPATHVAMLMNLDVIIGPLLAVAAPLGRRTGHAAACARAPCAHLLGVAHSHVVAHRLVLALGRVAPRAHHLLDALDVLALLRRERRIDLRDD